MPNKDTVWHQDKINDWCSPSFQINWKCSLSLLIPTYTKKEVRVYLLSIYPSIPLIGFSTHLSNYLTVCLFVLNPSINHPVHSFLNLSIHPSHTVCLFTHSLIHKFILSVHPSKHPASHHLSVHLPVCPSIIYPWISIFALPTIQFIHSPINFYISPFIRFSVSKAIHPSVQWFIHPSVLPSIHPSMKHLASSPSIFSFSHLCLRCLCLMMLLQRFRSCCLTCRALWINTAKLL